MTPRVLSAVLACCAVVACSGEPGPAATSSSPSTATPPSGASAASPRTPAAATPEVTGADVVWPRAARGAAPPAYGAVETLRRTTLSDGTVLARGLVLPRVGGTVAAPVVLAPCGQRATAVATDLRVIPASRPGRLPKPAADVLVVIDPGHGGEAAGAVAPDRRTPEKLRTLEIAREVRTALAGRVGRVVFTRDRDMNAVLAFRVALADALRADAAVSVHLNSSPDQTDRSAPGLETYGSVADPEGRRFAGVLYAAQRRYLDTLGGPWAGDRDAGAKYRLNTGGTDYYGLLRRAHTPWVISESMFISAAREAALVARPDVRTALGGAIADGLVAFTTSGQPGSGWVRPYPRPADPSAPGGSRCTNPSQ